MTRLLGRYAKCLATIFYKDWKTSTWESLFPRRITEAASDAAFSFASICKATPTSASAKDGASFMPSPIWKHDEIIRIFIQSHKDDARKNTENLYTMFYYKHCITIATWCPSACILDTKFDFCCGVRDAFILSSSIPTIFPILATASFLSPDNRTVLIPFSWSLPIQKERVSNFSTWKKLRIIYSYQKVDIQG